MATETQKPVVRGNVDIGELIVKARQIAAHTGETVAEVVIKAATPAIDRRHKQCIENAHRVLGGEGGA